MIVIKFGGTSVQDSFWIDKAIDITNSMIDRAPVLVASAMAKTTDRLINIANCSFQKNKEGIIETIDILKKVHIDAAEAFLTGENLAAALKSLNTLFDHLSYL